MKACNACIFEVASFSRVLHDCYVLLFMGTEQWLMYVLLWSRPIGMILFFVLSVDNRNNPALSCPYISIIFEYSSKVVFQ